jgi:DNA-binding response OmpR family regulator
MHIALLEDNLDIAEVTTIMLEAAGYRVSPFPTGSAFLQALFPGPELAHHYHLAIVDLTLPDIQGIDVLVAIRQTHQVSASQLPIIVISAAAQEIARVKSRFPTIPVVPKPFHTRDLLLVIATLLEPQQQRREAV